MPQSRLNTLNRMYRTYYAGKEDNDRMMSGQYGSRYGQRRYNTPSSPYANTRANVRANYQDVTPQFTNEINFPTKYPKGTAEDVQNYYGNPPPMIPYYNYTGAYDPSGFMADYKRSQGYNPVAGSGRAGEGPGMYDRRFVQGQYGAKFNAYTPTTVGELPMPAQQDYGYGAGGYGGGGGIGYGYGYGGGGGYGGGYGGSYDRSAPSGAAPQQAQGANVQYTGQAQQGYRPANQVPQWYRKLLSWNF